MKILNYEAHNVMRVSDVRFDLEGHHLFLVGGKNYQGKSSSLKALLMALCGKSGCDYPEIALKEGENRGHVRVKLSGSDELHEPEGLTIELLLRRKRGGEVVEELRVLDSTGDEAPEPRNTLKRLYSLKAFDPLAFARLTGKEQKALLEKLLGLDFAVENAKHKVLYDQRTIVNRDGAKLKAQFEAMPHHPDAPAKEVSSADLLAELEQRQAVNKANRKLRDELKTREDLVRSATDAVTQRKNQIAELQRQLLRDEEELAQQQARLEEQRPIVATLEDKDEAEIRAQIKSADATNEKVRANMTRANAATQLQELRRKSEQMTQKMADIKAKQSQAIAEAKWPVPGMSFDEDGVTLNGLPFEQASKSQRIMASVEIGIALNPSLRLLVCESGGDLDLDTLQELERLLEVHDFQMIVEIVTRTKEDEQLCAVVIKDGVVEGQEIAVDDDEDGEPAEESGPNFQEDDSDEYVEM